MEGTIPSDSELSSDSEPMRRPVVVIINNMPDGLPPSQAGLKIKESPLGDVSVVGLPDDQEPIRDGVKEMATVIQSLESSGIPCCMVHEPALLYFGAGRTMFDWVICVPTEQLQQATDLLSAQSEITQPFRASAMARPDSLAHLYPRYKLKRLSLFFVLMTSQACHISCQPRNFEYTDNGIPYPKLHVLAQALLDTCSYTDLEDLIDGMNLTPTWGEENLNLDGHIDADWLLWRVAVLLGREPSKEEIPGLCIQQPSRHEIWIQKASAEARKRRQGFKYRPGQVTRWRREGQNDPRMRTGRFR